MIGDDIDELLDLPAISLGTGRVAVEVAVGDYHTLVRLSDGSVIAWGDGVCEGVGCTGIGGWGWVESEVTVR